jgi:hypothetical protein
MPLSSFHCSEAHFSGHAEQRQKLGRNDGANGSRFPVLPEKFGRAAFLWLLVGVE